MADPDGTVLDQGRCHRRTHAGDGLVFAGALIDSAVGLFDEGHNSLSPGGSCIIAR